MFLDIFFFFFKQKAAYEVMPGLGGSEMFKKDRESSIPMGFFIRGGGIWNWGVACLLYPSDAADEPLCLVFGGPRTIKKKNTSAIS